MKVKIKDIIYDSNNVGIMLILSDEEKKHLKDMGDAHKYCSVPESWSIEDVQEFMYGNY
jgi:hypothetical protein